MSFEKKESSDIIYQMLNAAKEDWVNKSMLARSAETNNNAHLGRYITKMLWSGLIEEKDGKYKATENGLGFMQDYERLKTRLGSWKINHTT